MILDLLTLENFGVYGGIQAVRLTPESAERPIILFGGLNGGGKTTLLDAIQLVLYGSKARLSTRPRSYREGLREAIHRGVDPEVGASIELQFRRVVEGKFQHYVVKRSWRMTNKGMAERLEVQLNDEPDPLLAEHWDESIEAYLPSGISHLFFFDAEQITELAEGRRAAELLGTAIHSLLGLEIVDRLDTDLTVLERRKRGEGQTTEDARRLRDLEAEVGRLEDLFSMSMQELGRLTNEEERKAHEVSRTEEQFRDNGGEFYERRTELESQQTELRRKIASHEAVLREIVAGPGPFLLIDELLAETESEMQRASEVQRNRVLMQALEVRDAEIIDLLGKRRIAGPALDTIHRLFAEDRRAREATLSSPELMEVDEHVAHEIRHLRNTILPAAHNKVRAELAEIQNTEEKLVRIETALARVPATDSIAAVQHELMQRRLSLAAKQAEIQAHEARQAALHRDLERARIEVVRETELHTDGAIQDESRLRILKHSAKVRKTLQAFRREIIRKHSAHIETLMLESFTQLLRKSSLISDLRIDPDTFTITLTGGDGNLLPFNRLSAGERQLLATSLLWGLAKASGRPLPTIIDTPLGRLDSSHRKHLLERYFPVASHQVILLSTDEEITETSLVKIQPFVGRAYRLVHDDQLRSTVIKKGYFWDHEATN